MQQNLTEGPVTRSMLLFALPMILGNLLQQLYNVADTLIVGRCLGPDALAEALADYYAGARFVHVHRGGEAPEDVFHVKQVERN